MAPYGTNASKESGTVKKNSGVQFSISSPVEETRDPVAVQMVPLPGCDAEHYHAFARRMRREGAYHNFICMVSRSLAPCLAAGKFARTPF